VDAQGMTAEAVAAENRGTGGAAAAAAAEAAAVAAPVRAASLRRWLRLRGAAPLNSRTGIILSCYVMVREARRVTV
jgi:hypothetical protein